MAEIRRHLPGAPVAIIRVLCQSLGDDVIERRRNAPVAAAGGRRHFVNDLVEDSVQVVADKRREAGQHLVEHGAKGKDIGAAVHLTPGHLFRRYVLGRAENGTGQGARSRG